MSEHTPNKNNTPQKRTTGVTATGARAGGGKAGDIKYEKRKRANTGCLTGVLYVALIIAASFGLAIFGWNCADDVLALTKTEGKLEFEVKENYTISELSKELEDKGVIEHAWLFNFYCKFSNATVDPGKYELELPLDYRAIVYALKEGSKQAETVTVTIREGLTLKQTLDELVTNEVSTVELMLDAMKTYDFSHEFLADIPKSENRLEGYLYPDTYDFFVGEDPVKVLNKFLNNFNRKLTSDFRNRIEDMDYTLHEIITIASLIEMESRDNMEDKKNIASVIYNRLENWDNPILQIDATIQYILPERVPRVLNEHLEIESPYNTYKYAGLPPGPICSPSVDSIRAALYPSNTNNYYYALQDDGTHAFVKTPQEHEKIKQNNPETYGPQG